MREVENRGKTLRALKIRANSKLQNSGVACAKNSMAESSFLTFNRAPDDLIFEARDSARAITFDARKRPPRAVLEESGCINLVSINQGRSTRIAT